jgi:AcrR family transcriptional regulator
MLTGVTQLSEPRSRRDRPAKPPLSRAAIVETALDLARQDGLGAVTLRNVAKRLDTGPASLYVYVANRDDLLERLLDRALSGVPVAPVDPGRWQQQLTGLFTAALDALCRYPGLAQVALGSIPVWPSALAITDNALALMRAGGIPDQAAAWAADALYLLTAATAVEHGIERRRPPTAPHHKAPAADYRAVRELYAALPADRYPAITSMAETLTRGDDAQRFAFAVTAIINGAADPRLFGPPCPDSGASP